jgi:2-keto-4-pentenoate hydratase/2-oxohepta-3-ene-1,7-dioic acid hydratase in catechol pathway/regulator of RNase E activity RraA
MSLFRDRPPGKIIAVHLSYRSRAAERGRIPAFPSYFLKPSSSLARSGDEVVRPDGCELLAFEGEIALVIGSEARRVPVSEAWQHVGWVTAANDFGVYDLRYADSGSNLRSKGSDGFTPMGPRLIDASGVDPHGLRLRTWVNGEIRQDARTGDELIFGFDQIVADLSRLMTLEVGDVILTGTPTGSSVVGPGDVVEVEVSTADGRSTGPLRSVVIEDGKPLDPIGAMPKVDDDTWAAAHGTGAHGTATQATGAPPARTGAVVTNEPPGPAEVTEEVLGILGTVSTATLSSQLLKRGLGGCTMNGLRATRPGRRMLGRARTVEYLPLREDLFEDHGRGFNAQKRAVEAIKPGEVLVIGARGEPDAGTIGDLLALRAKLLGAAGIVTDGATRDYQAIAGMDFPVYVGSVHPAVLGRRHVPWTTDVAVACAGVLVEPGDLLVGDGDGVVVIPERLAAAVAYAAREQEREERFIHEMINAGESVDGLYPISKQLRPAYEAWCARTEQT